ncbi:galectin-3-binding protein-like [Montipora capricornis]|uniref:galectin-3-binding protein-like n=1 Tax=Montipora capricornis TaxID=246305 RepID=UPI0035F16584
MSKLGPSGLICIICWFYQGVVVSGVAVPDEGDVRLADGGALTQGRVEIYMNGSWWTVCSNWFSYAEARVVCRMLWLPENPLVYRNNPFGGRNGSILTEWYDCDGHESSLLNCARRGLSYYCSHYSKSVGISCGPLIMSECGGVITEPVGQLSFKRGQMVTETQCQWTMGDSTKNGKHIVLVPDKKMNSCSFRLSVWDASGNWLSYHSCVSEWFFIYTLYPGVTVQLRSNGWYDDVFSLHYAVINGRIESGFVDLQQQ